MYLNYLVLSLSLADGIILLSTVRQGQHQRLDLNICIMTVSLKMNENGNAPIVHVPDVLH